MLDIGAQLRETRMRRRIDISEVEAATKIRAKYLRALENEEWSLLPGPTFVKTFLRTYAEYLGLDARSLVEEYRQRYEHPSTSELTPLRPGGLGGRPPRRRRPVLGPWVVVAGVLVALVAALYFLGTSGDNGDETPGSNTAQQRSTPTPTATPAKKSKHKKKKATASSRVVRVQISATGTVWVCMENAAGTPVVNQRTMQAGDRTQTFKSSRFRVAFGNGSARLRVNGKNVQVPGRSDAVGFDLRAGRKPRELPTGQRPTCA
jgi:cytoskeletal protein RodZ